MSLLERIETPGGGGEEIEPGKRLIRAGDDRGISLSERLAYRLHRLAWRTPFPQPAPARPLPAEAARRSQGSGRGRQSGGRGDPGRADRARRQPCRYRQIGFHGSRSRPRAFRLSAKLRLAARPGCRGHARKWRGPGRASGPEMARPVRRPGQRAGMALRFVGAPHTLLVVLRALHPFQPRSRLPLGGPQRAGARITPHRPRRRPRAARPGADHGLGRRHSIGPW
jgi:hypothetical protein